MHVHIVCQNWKEERIVPRMARALAERLGWGLSATAAPCDVLYLSAYFEAQRVGQPGTPTAAYFTHREEEPPGNAKARVYDQVAERVQLRVATCRLYAEPLEAYGPTVQIAAPLERERFAIAGKAPEAAALRTRPVVGFSGYTYPNKRKGEDLVRRLIESPVGQSVEWRASGRGWPVPTKGYSWADMPAFYQGLDVLVVPSRVEGIPMPPLEALACGVRVVIPRGVGLLDELPDVLGIVRYERGDTEGLIAALEEALETEADPAALRAATERYGVDAWCAQHARAFEDVFGDEVAGDRFCARLLAPVTEPVVSSASGEEQEGGHAGPPLREPGARGIYCVAFGEQARGCARRMMETAKRHMPDVPICLCGAAPIGVEDVFVEQPDSDVGARRAKLLAYQLAPAEWQTVLYLDADTEVIAPVYQLFEWVEDGWELAICTDIRAMETLRVFERKASQAEVGETLALVGTADTLQYNGGVWAFQRCAAVERFFARWLAEWERWAQRDQGALLRALHAEPLRVWLLGNEWNTFPRFQPGQETAGILHWPGRARRWEGTIPGRIDGDEAWGMVRQFEERARG